MSAPDAPRRGRIRRGLLIAIGSSLVVATLVVAWIGFGQVFAALARIGWRGLAVLAAWSVLPIALLGSAWFCLEKPWRAADWGRYVWARMVRDASGELLPFSHVGGFFIGARAATLQGLSAPWAFASTVVDVTAELVAQIGFTAVGVILLLTRLDAGSARDGLVGASLAGLAITAVAAAAFIGLQRRGMGLILALARRFLPAAAAGAAETGAMIADLHARPARFSLAVGAHLAAWIASALGPWLALRAAGIEIGPLAIVGLESLVMAVRSAAFVAPMGIGVQEASYALLGPLFGLGPEVALAVSLIKRARDILIGLPVLFVWQGLEGRRLIARRG
ncbi:MAG TPA: lysylphosphatidylglycerol synthase domain-containing protein [Caulobacteraceae bacterium]|nr:lysylphosphatidylglycerol synthase domain-containing protein [Caulobacteraceae bacterium]